MTEADLAAIRTSMTDRLLEMGVVRSGEVAEAFRDVPRHLFLPGVDPVKAYADEAIPVKWAADGRPLSSSSQPAMMAIMLEQLRLAPGQRVLEIGTGTGYNAALLARVVGETGIVVTVDIDEELTEGARQRLNAAGHPAVVVIHGDGAAGWPGQAPYDRIVVTAGARDLAPAWTGQLGDGGRLVVPLSLRGVVQSVAFVPAGDHLASTSVVPCGFIPLTGELAGHDPVRPLGEIPGVFLHLEEDRTLDLEALHAALSQPREAIPTGVSIIRSDIFAGLRLWLALHDRDVGELTAVGPAAGRDLIPSITSLPGMDSTSVLVGETGLAAVERPPGSEQPADFEACVRGYGPEGDRLAERLAAGIRGWESAGRPARSTLRIRAYPAVAADREPATFTIETPHSRFLLDW